MHRNQITKLLDDDDPFCRAALARYKVSSSLEERLYATTDANHNVTSIDDVFGAVKERFVYDPYRNSTVLTSAFATTSDAYGFIVRSQGQREDATTNTIDSRNRVYGLGIGRWMQADNIGGYVDGANRYQFVGSNPERFLDASGLAITESQPIVVGTITLLQYLDAASPLNKIPIPKYWGTTQLGFDNQTELGKPPPFSSELKKPIAECILTSGKSKWKVTLAGHYEPNFNISVKLYTLIIDKELQGTAAGLQRLQRAVDAWNAQTVSHEAQHVADAKRIYHPFDAVGIGKGATEVEAFAAAFDQLDTTRVAEIEKMALAENFAVNKLHERLKETNKTLLDDIINQYVNRNN